jgi:hypothetical protein
MARKSSKDKNAKGNTIKGDKLRKPRGHGAKRKGERK